MARQTGIDVTSNPYFTCIDADDTFLSADSLETLRRGLETSDNVKCYAGAFLAKKQDGTDELIKNMSSMDVKRYRRDFIRNYDIRFNGTRSNENMVYDMIVRMLCDNPNSITNAGDKQFIWDQLFCCFVDNFI